MKVRRWVAAGVVFGVLWVFIRGASLTVDSLVTNFLVGTAVGLPVAYVFRRLYEEELDVGRSLGVVPSLVFYLAAFVREVFVANLDVTYRVLAPGMPLEPQVILVPLRVQTPLGVTVIANSINITPGTLALDHDPDENVLYVHGIDGRDPEAIVRPIRRWEDYALVIFDEERSPDDPPPEIVVHPPGHVPEPRTIVLDRPDDLGTGVTTTDEDRESREDHENHKSRENRENHEGSDNRENENTREESTMTDESDEREDDEDERGEDEEASGEGGEQESVGENDSGGEGDGR